MGASPSPFRPWTTSNWPQVFTSLRTPHVLGRALPENFEETAEYKAFARHLGCLVMEWVDGNSRNKLVESGTCPPFWPFGSSKNSASCCFNVLCPFLSCRFEECEKNQMNPGIAIPGSTWWMRIDSFGKVPFRFLPRPRWEMGKQGFFDVDQILCERRNHPVHINIPSGNLT